jgi:16S rRNA (cytosine1402-N4)-methyltransferase
MPIKDDQLFIPAFKLVGKPVKPSAEEVKVNIRSRSAIMRIGERNNEC